jgi:hypothetical protein
VVSLLGPIDVSVSAFPPEERTTKFDTDVGSASLSRLVADAYLSTAQDIALAATERLAERVGCGLPAAPAAETECVHRFIDGFAARAYRRPLADDERTRLRALYAEARAALDLRGAVQVIIETVLQAPQFLYRIEANGAPDPATGVASVGPFELATRLSYFLWGGPPDERLLEAARAGRLAAAGELRAQAERMLDERRGRATVLRFHEQWLSLDGGVGLAKNSKLFPRFTAEVARLMKTELDTFVERSVFDGAGDLRTLLSAPHTYANPALAAYYGLPRPAGQGFERVTVDPSQRAGLLTQGLVMAALATAERTHPIHRGIFVMRDLLCSAPPPPPPGVAADEKVFSTKGMTARQKLQAHEKDPVCAGCHTLIDPPGLALENLDAAGQWRALDEGQPIDARATIPVTDAAGTVNGPGELARKVAASGAARACLVRSWFEFALGRPPTDADACTLAWLQERFTAAGESVRELALALAESDAFRYRAAGAR